jgi:hypothetical protein
MASTSGTLTATGSVTLTKPDSDTSTIVTLSGTYGTVTLVLEGTYDGTNWFALAATSFATGAVVTGTISPVDNAELGWRVPSEHLCKVRARVTAIASGTAELALSSASFVGINGPLTVSSSATIGASTFTGDVLLNDAVKLKLGDGSDITVAWDGTDLDVLQATPDSSIKWGVDAAGIDQVFYGDTASTNMTWDQSADSLILNGAARLVFTGTTGQPEIHLTDNLADALSVEISGSTDLLTFTTTNNAESVSPIGLRTRSSTAVAITGATALTLADSGGIFTVSQGAAYDVDLPSPTTGPGCSYFFSLTAPGANNVTITVLGGAATFVGSIITEGQIVVATGSTLTFATGASVLGDSIEIRSIATNLYHVRAVSAILNGITVS